MTAAKNSNNRLPQWILALAGKILSVLLTLGSLYFLIRISTGVNEDTGISWLLWILAAVGVIAFIAITRNTRNLALHTEVARHDVRTKRVFSYIGLFAMLIIVLFPIYWMVISSFQPSQRVMLIPPTLTLTSESGLHSYAKVFSQPKYLRYFANSFLISFGTVIAVMVIALPAGYSFSRYTFKGKSALLTLILSVQMFPIVVVLISLYSFYLRWNLLDTHWGVILADTTFAMPLAITLMRSFFDTLPRSLDESARIDGAGRFQTMFQILLPLTLPGLVAVGIYTFLNAWDDYLMALTILTSESKKTLTVGLAASFLGEYSNDYSALLAFSVGGSLPIVLMFIFFQKYMISGLTAGAVKG